MKNIFVFIFVLIVFQEIIPQSINYFPLSLGNEYQFHDYYNNFYYFKIEKDSLFKEKTYYYYPHELGYCRTDSSGNLYSISHPFFTGGFPKPQPDEYLLFKANAQVGEVWKVAWDFNPVIDTGYAECFYADTGYLFGKYRKIKGIRIFDFSYDHYFFFLAEDIGIDEDHYDILPSGVKLNYTKIDSVIYGVLTANKDKKNQPYKYLLYQNYPNPFNPSTTISYSIPKSRNVTLRVYDILGREVATLVNESKDEGSYFVNFNASKLSSGIYIYQLRANDFVSSKKMILTK
jgi:hypothetical protein